MGGMTAAVIYQRDSVRKDLLGRFESRGTLAAEFVDAYVQELVIRQRATAGRLLSDERVDDRSFAAATSAAGFEAALLLDAKGRVLQSLPHAPALQGQPVGSKYAHLGTALRGRVGISNVVPSAVEGIPVTAVAVPFDTDSGRRVISGAYAFRSSPLAPYLDSGSVLRLERSFIIDAQGLIVAASSDMRLGRDSQRLADVDRAVSEAVGQARESSYVVDGRRQLVSQRPIAGTPWRLVRSAPADAVFSASGPAGVIAWIVLAALGAVGLMLIRASDRRWRAAQVAELERVRFFTAFEQAPHGMAMADLGGRLTRANAALCALTGYTADQLCSMAFRDITHPDELELAAAHMSELLKDGSSDSYSREARFLTADGDSLWVHVAVSLVRSATGVPQHLIAQVQSVIERKQLEEHLRRLADEDSLTGLWNRRRLEIEVNRQLDGAVSDGIKSALLVLDLDRFKEVNDGYGHEAGDRLLCGVGDALRSCLRRNDSIARLGGDEFAVVLDDITPDAAAAVAETIAQAVRNVSVDVDGDALRTSASIGLAFFGELAESAEEVLARADLAMYDTKFAARDGVVTATTPGGRKRGSEPPSRPVTVLHCDDSEPYRRLIKEMLTIHGGIDVVAEAATHGAAIGAARRTQPDVVLLDLDADRDEHVIAELRATVPHVRILVLSGLSSMGTDTLARSADAVISKTASFDELAAAIRQEQSERLASNPSRESERSAELGWLSRIKRALTEGRFVLFAQPIVDIATGAVIQHELLIRMIGEDGGLVAPGQFLPAAERYGLIAEIDHWVITQGAALAARGHNVDINISGDSLADPDLGARIERELRLAGADPRLLAIEITETALAKNEGLAVAFVQRMTDLGCSVALDDFGTGYAGFSYLKKLPVDRLKIDMEFVRDLLSDTASEQVVKAIVQMAVGMGKTTVAEGVEDAATLEKLASLGVDAAQGYHLGRPAPAADALIAPLTRSSTTS